MYQLKDETILKGITVRDGICEESADGLKNWWKTYKHVCDWFWLVGLVGKNGFSNFKLISYCFFAQ